MCETGPINQKKGLKYDQEFGRTLSILVAVGISVSSSQKEQILTAVKNLSTSTEVIEKTIFAWATSTRISRSLLWSPFPTCRGDWRIIQWRETARTWDRGVLDMHIVRSIMHPRDKPSKRIWSAWHDRGRHTEWSKWGSEPRTSRLHWTLVPENNNIEAPVSS